MADGAGFAVDVGAVARLLGELRSLRDDLGGQRGQRLDEAVSGSVPVSRAVARFVDRWDDGRERIRDNLGSTIDSLEAALRMYAEVEQAGTNAFVGFTR
ncbi:hypothetical protein [Actinokineospora sp. NBRC 105648]|uniref:hypothetical protein n=1 Tax=Actinokineospora sp. NBRC 105648 TaxID=3032206 RepID=UPI0024A2DF01|nr:hypothetical protein [Actinokineospora sp. NBRC 105648]GLZ40604.1 hypothetical protein Acsp05_42280 [Actinokineospora sp. NBRC 105648]